MSNASYVDRVADLLKELKDCSSAKSRVKASKAIANVGLYVAKMAALIHRLTEMTPTAGRRMDSVTAALYGIDADGVRDYNTIMNIIELTVGPPPSESTPPADGSEGNGEGKEGSDGSAGG